MDDALRTELLRRHVMERAEHINAVMAEHLRRSPDPHWRVDNEGRVWGRCELITAFHPDFDVEWGDLNLPRGAETESQE